MPENPIIIDHRILNRQPTAEIQALRTKWHHLYQRRAADESQLCSSSALNFLGAIIVETIKTKILAQFDNTTPSTRPHPAMVEDTVRIENRVALWQRIPASNTPLKIEVNHVLVKRDPGKTAGVVLSGPYAGLLLEEKIRDQGIKTGMTINRVWNEDPSETSPYRPMLITEEGTEHGKAYEVYHEKRDEVLALRATHPLSQIFFMLLKELSISVDQKAFHTSNKIVQ